MIYYGLIHFIFFKLLDYDLLEKHSKINYKMKLKDIEPFHDALYNDNEDMTYMHEDFITSLKYKNSDFSSWLKNEIILIIKEKSYKICINKLAKITKFMEKIEQQNKNYDRKK